MFRGAAHGELEAYTDGSRSDGIPVGVKELVDRCSDHITARNRSKSLPVSQDNAEGGEDIEQWLAIVDREVGVLLQDDQKSK